MIEAIIGNNKCLHEIHAMAYDMKLRSYHIYEVLSEQGIYEDETIKNYVNNAIRLERKRNPQKPMNEILMNAAVGLLNNINSGLIDFIYDEKSTAGYKVVYPSFNRVPVEMNRLTEETIRDIKNCMIEDEYLLYVKKVNSENKIVARFKTLKAADEYMKNIKMKGYDYFVIKSDLSKVYEVRFHKKIVKEISKETYERLKSQGANVYKLYNGVAYGRF